MRAEVISVGTELLMGATVDTNAAALGEVLVACGIDCMHRQTVGDHLTRVSEAFQLALSRADIVIAVGGLGPTMDDLTREGLALALGLEIRIDADQASILKNLFESRKLLWVESNLRQAQIFDGADFIQNSKGSAPGIWWTDGSKYACLLPGPPGEFQQMVKDFLAPELLKLSNGRVIYSETLKVAGMGESRVAELLAEEMKSENPTIAPYAKTAEVHLRITSSSESFDDAKMKVSALSRRVRSLLGGNIFGADEETLESVVVQKLSQLNKSVSTAESCTGGLLSARITSVPGAAKVFLGGISTYTVEVKTEQLGVPKELIDRYSAVSEQVAREMAEGAVAKFGTDFGIGITGVAGPGADIDGNEEGLIYIALATKSETTCKEFQLGKGRDITRERAVQNALLMLWMDLNGQSG